MGFVGDDDDVAAVREEWEAGAALVGEELLDGGEDDAAGGDGEKLFQMIAVLGLDGLLRQQVLAAGEGGEELVVEIVAVGEEDEGGVFELRVGDDAAGVE